MKILAIGNSFSDDGTQMLYKIAKSANVDLTVGNLIIGGCPLEKHANNILNNLSEYRYDLNGEIYAENVSVEWAAKQEKWDIVTIQQVSQLSGKIESYYPYAITVLDYIKENLPEAKNFFHQTWAYEIDSTHSGFELYNRSQQQMYNEIIEASYKFCNTHNLPIIPCGQVVQELRKEQEFNYQNGGESLNRDGFHASLTYGRYALALTWLETLTNTDAFDVTFAPENTEEEKRNIVKLCVHKICSIRPCC